LDYAWAATPSVSGPVLRTVVFDEAVKRYLQKEPQATVVELGCGLNDRFSRVDNGQVTWFDLDLPDSMDLRMKFYQDGVRNQMISGSVTDSHWVQQVKATSGPWLFVSEAVFPYLSEDQARYAIQQIAHEFPGAALLLDTVSTNVVDRQSSNEFMKVMNPDCWFKWKCDDPKVIEDWTEGCMLLDHQLGMADVPINVASRSILPNGCLMTTSGYHINFFAGKLILLAVLCPFPGKHGANGF